MGYDLHIVRCDHGTDAASHPISKDDIDALVSSDPELAWSKDDFVEMRDSETNLIARYYAILWNNVPLFIWLRHQVTCKNPDDKQIAKMVRMAEALNARVVGDDGERYEMRRSFLGKQKVVAINP